MTRAARHGFLLSGGAFATLDPPGSDPTRAHGINTPDRSWGCTEPNFKLHGFLLSGGVYTTLDPPGSILTQASGSTTGPDRGSYRDSKWCPTASS